MPLADLDISAVDDLAISNEVPSRAADPIRDVKQYFQIVDLLKNKPRDQVLFLLGTTTNLRGGDLLSLTIKDALSLEMKGYCIIKEQKTDKRREIYLNPDIKPSFVRYLRERLLSGAQKNDRFFMGRKGPIKRPYFSHLVQAWCAAVGVPGKISGHTLRKTYGYFQYHYNGASLPALMADFNHSSQAITLTYIGVTDKCERQQRVHDFFNFINKNDAGKLFHTNP